MTTDVVIIGAGAAGLMTAIWVRRFQPDRSVVVLEGGENPGAKILISGGGRCNVTHRVVTPQDYNGGSRNTIKRILSAFSVEQTIAFFREIGVDLREEDGKLFPVTNRAKTVLDAMLAELQRLNVPILTRRIVIDIIRKPDSFSIMTSQDEFEATHVVLATGGLSFSEIGSDGSGYAIARQFGHAIIPTTPALVPLVLHGTFHRPLTGISHPAELTLKSDGAKPVRCLGPLLWTHFGISGPVTLDMSRHYLRARLENRNPKLELNFVPGHDAGLLDHAFTTGASDHPRVSLQKFVSRWIPERLAQSLLSHMDIDGSIRLCQLPKPIRRRIVTNLLSFSLDVKDSRGYNHAEVTAGGIPLSEINPSTMESRKQPGLYLVGETLDADGRIGGFNFQWAWSTATVAAQSLAQKLR